MDIVFDLVLMALTSTSLVMSLRRHREEERREQEVQQLRDTCETLSAVVIDMDPRQTERLSSTPRAKAVDLELEKARLAAEVAKAQIEADVRKDEAFWRRR